MRELGLSRYRSQVARARSKGRMTDLPSGRILLRESMVPFTEALDQWRKDCKANRARNAGHISALLEGFSTDFVCALAARVIIDGVCRSQSFRNICITIGNHLEDERIVRHMKAEETTLWEQLVPKLKYAGEDKKRSTMRGIRLDWHKAGNSFPPLCRSEKVDIGCLLTVMFSECTGFIEIRSENNPGKRATQAKHVVPSDALLKWLETTDKRHELLKPVWLPLISKPRPWVADYAGGYPPELSIRTPFVKALDRKAAIEAYTAKNMPEVFSAVSRIQETPWSISPVLQVANDIWAEGNAVCGLPRRLDEEVPERPDTEDETVLKNYKQMARVIHQENRAHRSKRLQVMKTLWAADQYKDEAKIYFPHNLCFRGRAYPIPGFLSPQGSDMAKGLLRFSKPSELTPECRENWAIQGANTWGLDKAPFDERVSWVDDNWELIAKIREAPMEHREWQDADKPWQFLNWCLDEPSAPQVPICADGTNNGLQVIAALTGDAETAFHTNLIRSEKPQDIYSVVAERATLLLRNIQLQKKPGGPFLGHKVAKEWLEFWGGEIPRSAVKRQVMTQPYGSTRHSCCDYTFEAFKAHESYRRTLWPDDQYSRTYWLSGIIWEAITDCLKGPRQFMDWAAECAKEAARAGVFLQWEMPTGFRVFQRYRKWKVKKVRSDFGWRFNLMHRIREYGDEASPSKAGQATPANVVHSIDAAAMMRTVNLAHEAGVREFAMVHDDFGTSAASAPTMARCTREAYVQILSEVTLEGIHREWQELCEGQGVKLPLPPERGDFRVEEILDSPYFFS